MALPNALDRKYPNDRILNVQNGKVTLSYRDRKDGERKKTLPLEAHEFIRRFLLHVLPEGFMRVGHFGFLANRSKKQALTQCRNCLGQIPLCSKAPVNQAKDLLLRITGIDLSRCPSCHNGTMIVVAELPRYQARLDGIPPEKNSNACRPF